MAKLKQDFEIFSGDTKDIEVEVTDTGGTLIDLSGALGIKWVLKRSPSAVENLVLKSLGSGITVGGLGKIIIRLNSSDTEGIIGNYFHGCELTDSLNNVSTLLIGTATIKKSGL